MRLGAPRHASAWRREVHAAAAPAQSRRPPGARVCDRNARRTATPRAARALRSRPSDARALSGPTPAAHYARRAGVGLVRLEGASAVARTSSPHRTHVVRGTGARAPVLVLPRIPESLLQGRVRESAPERRAVAVLQRGPCGAAAASHAEGGRWVAYPHCAAPTDVGVARGVRAPSIWRLPLVRTYAQGGGALVSHRRILEGALHSGGTVQAVTGGEPAWCQARIPGASARTPPRRAPQKR